MPYSQSKTAIPQSILGYNTERFEKVVDSQSRKLAFEVKMGNIESARKEFLKELNSAGSDKIFSEKLDGFMGTIFDFVRTYSLGNGYSSKGFACFTLTHALGQRFLTGLFGLENFTKIKKIAENYEKEAIENNKAAKTEKTVNRQRAFVGRGSSDGLKSAQETIKKAVNSIDVTQKEVRSRRIA